MTQKIKVYPRKWRKVLIGLGSLAFFGCVVFFALKFSPLTKQKSGAEAGVRELQLADGYGRVFDLGVQARGRPVLVHFWASWCPPCLEEIHSFLKAGKMLANSERAPLFVAVAVDKNWSDVEKVVPRKEWPSEVVLVLDPRSQVADAWGSFQYPETYALDAAHRVVRKWVGSQDWEAVTRMKR